MNGSTILVLIIGIVLGYFAHIMANRKTNLELIAMLKDQHLLIQTQLQSSRLTEEGKNALIQKDIDIQNEINRINRQNLNLL